MRALLSTAALLLGFALALGLRLPQLGIRPLHNDEGVNATNVARLWAQGEYRYDPHEYHGPTLHYFSLPVLWLGPARSIEAISDSQLRVVTVAFGVGLILLLLLMRDGLGKAGAAWAAGLIAISPAMVFYSRYFIHEMLLVFFTLLTLAAGWRYARSRRPGWAALAGAGAGLMFATKETFVLSLAALAAALIATRVWNKWRRARVTGGEIVGAPRQRTQWPPPLRHTLLALSAALFVWALFFSSFFTNWNGLVDSIKTYLPWLSRAGGNSPHLHPWHFYLERLLWFHPARSPVWSEALIAGLALCGGAAGFCGNPSLTTSPGLARFLTFYTAMLTAIYSGIAYKTPWCLLNFWLGAILLAGIGAAALFQLCRTFWPRTMVVLFLSAGLIHLGTQAWQLSLQFASDLRNPYVYAQTSPHARELVERMRAIAQVAPTGFATTVKVISPESYWPLPWYLREFQSVGWYEDFHADPFAPLVLCSAKLDAKLDEKSDKRWIMTGYYELRPNVFLELYIERGLWEKFVATVPRDPD